METLDVFWVDTKSYLGQTIDVSNLVEATKAENMSYLTAEEIRQHNIGLLVIAGQWQNNQVDGYVACKRILTAGPSALIGGLYVAPEHRGKAGKGLAAEMVRRITNMTFEAYPYLASCVANCNRASSGVFGRLGYQALGLREDGKIRYVMYKDAWIAHQHMNDDL